MAIALAVVHFPELTQNVDDRVLSANSLLLLWVCFPFVRFLHELGHGHAVKAGGGEVREMGILLLVFMPVPYVEASAANGFRSKWRRTVVGSAGMLVELGLSALAMLGWAAAEPGMVRAVAFWPPASSSTWKSRPRWAAPATAAAPTSASPMPPSRWRRSGTGGCARPSWSDSMSGAAFWRTAERGPTPNA